MKNQNITRHYLFGISGWLPLRSALLLLTARVARLARPPPTAELASPTFGISAAPGTPGVALGTASLLTSGILVHGGGASAELYDPASGTWTATGSLATSRDF